MIVRLDASTFNPSEVSPAMVRPGGRVCLTLAPEKGFDRRVQLPVLRTGAWLEIRAGSSHVKLLGGRTEAEEPDLMNLWIRHDGETLQVSVGGGVRALGLHADRAHVELDNAFEIEELDVQRSVVDGVTIRGARVSVRGGSAVIDVEQEHARLVRCDRVAIDAADCGTLFEVVRVRGSVLDGVTVMLDEGGQLQDCSGVVRLVSARHAMVVGNARRPLVLSRPEASLVAGTADDWLEDAVVMDVSIDAPVLGDVLVGAAKARVFDPHQDSLDATLSRIPSDERTTMAEALHQCVSEKARRPLTIDAAAAAVLRVRRAAARRWRVDWLLLSGWGLFGYGRSVWRPLAAWLVVAATIAAIRLMLALDRPLGTLSFGEGATGPFIDILYEVGDVGFTIACLPLSWIRGADAASTTVGLEGGYLLLARILLAVPLIAAFAAARRRVRVRPPAGSRSS